MTVDEHRLMVFMFTRQMVIIRTLLEILKRDGIVKDDDYSAFESLIWEAEERDRTNFQAVFSQYEAFAKLLGLENQLPHARRDQSPSS
jgi:hypothetical protein